MKNLIMSLVVLASAPAFAIDADSATKCWTEDTVEAIQTYRMIRILHSISENGSAWSVINPMVAQSNTCLELRSKLEALVDSKLEKSLDGDVFKKLGN